MCIGRSVRRAWSTYRSWQMRSSPLTSLRVSGTILLPLEQFFLDQVMLFRDDRCIKDRHQKEHIFRPRNIHFMRMRRQFFRIPTTSVVLTASVDHTRLSNVAVGTSHRCWPWRSVSVLYEEVRDVHGICKKNLIMKVDAAPALENFLQTRFLIHELVTEAFAQPFYASQN